MKPEEIEVLRKAFLEINALATSDDVKTSTPEERLASIRRIAVQKLKLWEK